MLSVEYSRPGEGLLAGFTRQAPSQSLKGGRGHDFPCRPPINSLRLIEKCNCVQFALKNGLFVRRD